MFSGEASAVVGRTSDGELTVLAHHTDLVGDLVPGVVRIAHADGELAVVVHGGFLQVGPSDGGTLVTVLAGVAEPVATIDVARATAAKEAATAALAGRADDDDDDVRAARAALARAELRLDAAASLAR